MVEDRYSRRTLLVRSLAFTATTWAGLGTTRIVAAAEDPGTAELMQRFEYLSANGNSSCSGTFKDSIAAMPVEARLQGSCCSPMEAHRYIEQVAALRVYADITEIPPDPYDIQAGLAATLMAQYDLALTPAEQAAYDHAMENSNELGPCCCGCWRWYVYGGLAKQLIRERGFDGSQITTIWNLSDGCGGDEHAHG